ncbi:PsbP domain-containing protein 4 [Monoraphidium neglectum]|uniref:PsbP domain-containing protein 4 n=1 Tax=Monoraphidium neglectum TaxID=145388 RepID=A0A0D2N5P7_9CHLO|nr:PsbP domain-containing protein 4 [Monoraphidium neglectum]KIZ01281.1 PsbP domain-containing protein 4 [Monoraphidium neglectum]|eukprot:XP_013900300.1 PsbP domain-containing protein 4 [Monoraphidium neglectum]
MKHLKTHTVSSEARHVGTVPAARAGQPVVRAPQRLCTASAVPQQQSSRQQQDQQPLRLQEQYAPATSMLSADAALTRRMTLGLVAAAPGLLAALDARAVQGLTAGRIPGVSAEPDSEGFYTYSRPEGKSGWSEIPRYSFKVPAGWDETPVSIADLGGAEIDLRFGERQQGNLVVVVAPVARFADIGFNADVRIEDLGPPDRIIAGFAPELYGRPLDEGDVLEQAVVTRGGLSYYQWAVKPHRLVSATAVGNRLFLISVATPTARQWRKYERELRVIQESFTVPGGSA